MNIKEFSHEFEILYNNIMSNAAPGLSEYEKSVLLTKALEELILDTYSDKQGNSLEETEEVKKYLSSLIKEVTITTKANTLNKGISKKSIFFTVPKDIWFITYESVKIDDERIGCKNGQSLKVKAITLNEYDSIKENPFRKDNTNRVLRLDINNNLEIISDYNISEYYVRYLTKPTPIILEDISVYGVTIEGINIPTECALHEALHRRIINRAVLLAKSAYTN